VLSWQLRSGPLSSQYAPVGPSDTWWNDKWNDSSSFIHTSTCAPRQPPPTHFQVTSPGQPFLLVWAGHGVKNPGPAYTLTTCRTVGVSPRCTGGPGPAGVLLFLASALRGSVVALQVVQQTVDNLVAGKRQHQDDNH
jgi:hypothetical protein